MYHISLLSFIYMYVTTNTESKGKAKPQVPTLKINKMIVKLRFSLSNHNNKS